ncbi:MAG: Hpt domain-containing protein, partial [Alphaproteobacteria bacterium]
MDDLLKDFLTETNENMEVLDLEIVKLEQHPNDPELLSNIFRLVHTIKGTCGFLGLPRLEAVAHASENVLGKFRDGVLEVTPEAVTLIFASLDRIKMLLAALEQNQAEPEGDDKDLIARLDAMAERSAAAGKSGQATAPQVAPTREGAPGKASLYEQLGGFGPIDAAVETFTRRALSDERLGSFIKGLDLDRFRAQLTAFLAKIAGGPAEYDGVTRAQVHAYLAPRGFSEAHFGHAVAMLERALGEMDVPAVAAHALMGLLTAEREEWPLPAASEPAEQEESHEAAHAPEDKKPAGETGDGPGVRQSAVAAQNIRVNLALLENLMNLVSEMVLTRNQLLQILRAHKESDFTGPLQRLNQITTELQEEVMKTRMQPIGNA